MLQRLRLHIFAIALLLIAATAVAEPIAHSDRGAHSEDGAPGGPHTQQQLYLRKLLQGLSSSSHSLAHEKHRILQQQQVASNTSTTSPFVNDTAPPGISPSPSTYDPFLPTNDTANGSDSVCCCQSTLFVGCYATHL